MKFNFGDQKYKILSKSKILIKIKNFNLNKNSSGTLNHRFEMT